MIVMRSVCCLVSRWLRHWDLMGTFLSSAGVHWFGQRRWRRRHEQQQCKLRANSRIVRFGSSLVAEWAISAKIVIFVLLLCWLRACRYYRMNGQTLRQLVRPLHLKAFNMAALFAKWYRKGGPVLMMPKEEIYWISHLDSVPGSDDIIWWLSRLSVS